MRNIHGDLDNGNIIFGIDYDKLNNNFKKAPIEFSKSYRVLENGLISTFDISSDIDIIKIYGHGLGKADYSYYQSIFDSVDLYHGKLKLCFSGQTMRVKKRNKYTKILLKVLQILLKNMEQHLQIKTTEEIYLPNCC